MKKWTDGILTDLKSVNPTKGSLAMIFPSQMLNNLDLKI